MQQININTIYKHVEIKNVTKINNEYISAYLERVNRNEN